MKWNEYGGIARAAGSLRQYYGLKAYHGTDSAVDEWLNGHHFRCVAAILIDALGSSIIKKNCPSDGFFTERKAEDITTVFPPTTTAATTAFRTGHTPVETGWLGWNQYFREKDDNIILFQNISMYGDSTYDESFSWKTLPVMPLEDELTENGICADSVWPCWAPHMPSENLDAFCDNIYRTVTKPEMRFVYGYWDALDTCMHLNGTHAEVSANMAQEIEKKMAALAKRLPADTGLLIVADHSQIDVHPIFLEEDKEICACFRREPALEARSMAFYIEADKHEVFEELFHKKYGEHWRLYSHEEVMNSTMYGEGMQHPRFSEFIGDYIAVSDDGSFFCYKSDEVLKGHHAGGTREEAEIPVILFP